jgi:hypothetical protein
MFLDTFKWAGAAYHRQTRLDDACGISFLMVGDNKQLTFYGSDKTGQVQWILVSAG